MAKTKSNTISPPIFDSSLYRRLVVRPAAKRLAPFLQAMGFTGNGVCWLKLVFGLAGSVLLVSGKGSVGFLGMLLLQMNFLLDAADGEVARLAGEAGKLSGEYLDKLFDHLPKTAMYFCWGYGAFLLTGSHLALFCGAFFAAWNIYPRFCGVETMLERLDKAAIIDDKEAYAKALGSSFVTERRRGRADYLLTMFVHPAMNLLTIFFLLEILIPIIPVQGYVVHTRYIFLLGYTLAGLVNFVRKGWRFFRILDFS
jgi:phosphatidylglycerophosphate synthase